MLRHTRARKAPSSFSAHGKLLWPLAEIMISENHMKCNTSMSESWKRLSFTLLTREPVWEEDNRASSLISSSWNAPRYWRHGRAAWAGSRQKVVELIWSLFSLFFSCNTSAATWRFYLQDWRLMRPSPVCLDFWFVDKEESDCSAWQESYAPLSEAWQSLFGGALL